MAQHSSSTSPKRRVRHGDGWTLNICAYEIFPEKATNCIIKRRSAGIGGDCAAKRSISAGDGRRSGRLGVLSAAVTIARAADTSPRRVLRGDVSRFDARRRRRAGASCRSDRAQERPQMANGRSIGPLLSWCLRSHLAPKLPGICRLRLYTNVCDHEREVRKHSGQSMPFLQRTAIARQSWRSWSTRSPRRRGPYQGWGLNDLPSGWLDASSLASPGSRLRCKPTCLAVIAGVDDGQDVRDALAGFCPRFISTLKCSHLPKTFYGLTRSELFSR
jgi:hypothetical protein